MIISAEKLPITAPTALNFGIKRTLNIILTIAPTTINEALFKRLPIGV